MLIQLHYNALSTTVSDDLNIAPESISNISSPYAQQHINNISATCRQWRNNDLLNLYVIRWRPYRVECTGSLLTSEVKRHRARFVLGWGPPWKTLWCCQCFGSLASSCGSVLMLLQLHYNTLSTKVSDDLKTTPRVYQLHLATNPTTTPQQHLGNMPAMTPQ